ncbi:DegT/DnrJ/EryC1/StrS family aminotransferase [Spongiactinospora gelatinilytica]|uniref:DegT/DnrJ/EryC1/StrS family aminotransferase n=1 Tax=Spongiactinospora gelatinilytica TaxID=2666298 RepID=UPI001F217D8E|nr:DegT/DnrJ/EryC1/StrS family aminotransferase [Spongiactinospora gelatinilytica]
MYGSRHAIACNSGTAALHLSVVAAAPDPGDEIITTPITDFGTVAPILAQNAVPVFADVDPADGNLDPAAVAVARVHGPDRHERRAGQRQHLVVARPHVEQRRPQARHRPGGDPVAAQHPAYRLRRAVRPLPVGVRADQHVDVEAHGEVAEQCLRVESRHLILHASNIGPDPECGSGLHGKSAEAGRSGEAQYTRSMRRPLWTWPTQFWSVLVATNRTATPSRQI